MKAFSMARGLAARWTAPTCGLVAYSLLALGPGLEVAAAATLPSNVPLAGSPSIPGRVRVGLATDLERVSIPCCGSDLVAEVAGKRVAVASTLVVEPQFESAAPGSYRLQVAAFKDERQATGLAARLAERLGLPADAVFDAGTDLYRIRVGKYRQRQEAENDISRLVAMGYAETWIVTEPGRFQKPSLKVRNAGRVHNVPGRWLAVRSEGDGGEGIQVAQGRFRGDILVYLNDRGMLNLINEVTLEDYLRGVVPREMGPAVYDSLEALKAQTVAARTYTLRNMGEFTAEGYDICATPRCQVYGGMDSEHPLSDRAVSETASQVLLYGKELVDALYSSTCGGHTEDVKSIFPLKDWPYLRGVPCVERGVVRLTGSTRSGLGFPAQLIDRLLPVKSTDPRAELEGRLKLMAVRAGVPVPQDRLDSLERKEVRRYIASIFDLAVDARLFANVADLEYYVEQPPRGWRQADLELAAYFLSSRFMSGPVGGLTDRQESADLLYELALYLSLLNVEEIRFRAVEEQELVGQVEGETLRKPLADDYLSFRWQRGALLTGAVGILPGDAVGLYVWDGQVQAISHRYDPAGLRHDRTSRHSRWTRFREHAKLASLVRERYPEIGDMETIEILERGVSGRVKKMRVVGSDGATVDVEGLAVRWTLDLPETWFTFKRVRGNGAKPGSTPGWLFTGKGWGHGVGLCQIGAFGMGVRGHEYQRILSHYYTDVRLVRLPIRETPRRAAARSDELSRALASELALVDPALVDPALVDPAPILPAHLRAEEVAP